MTVRRLVAASLVTGLFVVPTGCGMPPPPGRSETPSASVESAGPIPSTVEIGLLAGPWLSSPIELDDPNIAVISDACSLAARDELGADAADLPTAIVDAQGDGFA